MNSNLPILGSILVSLLGLDAMPADVPPSAPASRPGQGPRPEPNPGLPGRGLGGAGGLVRINPIFLVLDSNSDGVIDEKEIADAANSLKKLDRDGNGRISGDEVRTGVGRPRLGPETRDLPPSRAWMRFDRNGDGKLSLDELPERFGSAFEAGDKNKDGYLSVEELVADPGAASRPDGSAPKPGARPVVPPARGEAPKE